MKKESEKQPRPARNAGDTRSRILAAARLFFSTHSYENIGTRDIAAAAGVDAALVNRYFGGKEALFAEAIKDAFHLQEHLPDDFGKLGEYLVMQIMATGESEPARQFNALNLLIRGGVSPATRELVAERFHAEFVLPLAARLKGRDTGARAALIASYVIGLAMMRHTIGSPLLDGAQRKALATIGVAIQACVNGTA